MAKFGKIFNTKVQNKPPILSLHSGHAPKSGMKSDRDTCIHRTAQQPGKSWTTSLGFRPACCWVHTAVVFTSLSEAGPDLSLVTCRVPRGPYRTRGSSIMRGRTRTRIAQPLTAAAHAQSTQSPRKIVCTVRVRPTGARNGCTRSYRTHGLHSRLLMHG